MCRALPTVPGAAGLTLIRNRPLAPQGATLADLCCCPSRGETAARPPVACRRVLGASANGQKAQEKNSRVTLEISQVSIRKFPASGWKNSGPPLEKIQTNFGKIPKPFWKNSGFQNYADVLGRGPILPPKTDFGKIPTSFWKNSGISLDKNLEPPISGRPALRGRPTRAPRRARVGAARASICAHVQHSKELPGKARPDICDMRTSRERNRQQLGISDGAAMRETRMTHITQRTSATEYTRGYVSGAHADQQENLEIQKSIHINTSCSSDSNSHITQ